MEALACELPVVATRITGIPELVVHEKTGILVEAGNIQDMANALQTMYDNPSRAKEMGKQGRAWVLDEFSLEKNTTRLTEYFNQKRTAS
jgi:glycosyltransferase involved in cell wall biosynthesis